MKSFALIYTILDMELNASNRPPHIEFLRGLLREGKIKTGWKFPDYDVGQIQAVLICRAESKEEVLAWFDKDPVVATGARTIEVRDAEEMSISF